MRPAHPVPNTQYLILFVYFTLASLFAVTTPPWQNPDEPAHYNYIAHIAETGRLPVLKMGDYDQAYLQRLRDARFPPELSVAPLRYEFHQPPLYYLLAAPIYWLTGGSLLALRLFTALLGGGVVMLVFFCTRTLFSERPFLALGAAAFAAFLPMHLAMMAAVNNDALAELLITGGVLVLLKWLKRADQDAGNGPIPDPRSPRLLLFSLLMGLGFLTKATAYILLPVGLIVVSTRLLTRSPLHPLTRPTRRALARLLLPGLLLGALWWARSSLVYGGLDFLGLGRHDQVVSGQPTTAGWIAANGWAAYWERAWNFTFKSFWGVFGWMGVFMDQRVYTLLLIFSAVALAGALYAAWRSVRNPTLLSPFQRWGLATYGLLLAGVAASYVWYNLGFIQHQGRYLFPAVVAWSLLFAGGWWSALLPGASRWIGVFLLVWAAWLGGTGLWGGSLDKWTLLFLVAGAGVLLGNGFLLVRLPQEGRLRRVLFAMPWLLLILLDVAVPFVYSMPQLAQ